MLAHELCHVIDRVGTKNQFSNQKEFKPLLVMYKQAHKKRNKKSKIIQHDRRRQEKKSSIIGMTHIGTGMLNLKYLLDFVSIIC